MEQFGWPDIIVTTIVFLSILIGIMRGLIKETLSLITWVLAVVLAAMFADVAAGWMTFTKEPFIRTIVAFFIIFISTVIVGSVINYFIDKLIRKTPFSTPDRALGGGFGLLRGVVIVTIVVLLAGLTPLTKAPWWQGSYAVKRFEILAIWVKEQLPEEHAKSFNFSDSESSAQIEKS